LIAIGASITAHCQPCFTYHLSKAREIGISNSDIKAAVAVGESLQRGATAAMHKHVRESLGNGIPASSCCRPEEPESGCGCNGK
jgi:AhpD family alkylhydroperoxidase